MRPFWFKSDLFKSINERHAILQFVRKTSFFIISDLQKNLQILKIYLNSIELPFPFKS